MKRLELLGTPGLMALTLAIVGLGLAGGPAELAAQRTLTVCARGCDFTTIQDAIDAAQPGDVIEVKAGTYRETLTIKNKRDLTLRGEGRDRVTLDGRAQEQEEIVPGIRIEDSRNITIRGFKITNGRRGLQANNSTGLVIADNLFEANFRQGIAIGSFRGKPAEARLLNNVVRNTQADLNGAHGQGIDVFGSQAVLEGNTIEGSADCGLRVTHSGERPGRVAGSGNVIRNNKGGDLCGNVPLTLLAEPPPEGTLDRVAVPQDARTIQEALHRVRPGGTIVVAAGLHLEQLQIYKSVTIRGAGSGRTVLQAPGPDWTAVNIATDGLEVVLEGLTVTGGRRGIQIDTGPEGRVTLRDVRVERNGTGNPSEVGILIFGEGAVTVAQSRITGNRGPAGLWAFGAPQIAIQNSTISQNEDDGIVLIGKANLHIRNSTISRNAQNGLWASYDTQVTLQQSTISDNNLNGIALRGNARGTVEGSMITRNVGAGIWLGDSAHVTIRNNRITTNKPNADGKFGDGIMVNANAQATIRNNTITGNARMGIGAWDQTRVTITGNAISNNGRHGINIGGNPELESVQAEISQNRVQNNRRCGVRTDPDPGIKIRGQGNTITGNRQGNLCGDLNKFPPGFGGGR